MISTAEAGLDRKTQPRIVDTVDLKLSLKPYRKFILKNGVEVFAIDAGAEEVMLIEWVWFAGNWNEQKNLQAASANYLLKNGTTKKTAFQINEHFEYYGSHLNRVCYNETASVTLHSLSKHVKELLPVVRELVTESIFPEEELRIYKKNMQQKLSVNLKKNEFVAGRLIDVYLYGESHPYGKYTKHEDFDAMNREDLVHFFETYYKTGRLKIFAAGKLPDNLEQLLNEQFGDLPVRKVEIQDQPAERATEKKYRVKNDSAGVQGAIRMARPFFNRHHPDFPKVQVLNNLFGGFFGSRLMANIREDKGYTYGIYSYIQNHIKECGWLISTEAGVDVSEAAVKEIYYEMKLLREKPVDDEELKLVRNYMMGTILGDLDGPFQILNRWKNIILNDLDENYFYHTLDVIRNITPIELQELAQKYLRDEDFYELIVV